MGILARIGRKILFFFDKVENINIGWRTVFFLAACIIAVRIVLEVTLPSVEVRSPFVDYIFLESWFLALFFSLIVFFSYVSGKKFLNAARLLLFGLPIIFIPLVGLWQGSVHVFPWPQGSWFELFYHIATFSLFHPSFGIYFALEIFIFLAAIFIYLFFSVSFVRSLLGTLGAYGILVFFALHGKIFGYFYSVFHITNLSETKFYIAVDFLILLAAAVFILWRENPTKAKAFVLYFRPQRLLFGGALSAALLAGALLAPTFYFLNLLCSFIVFNLLLLYAALSNDCADIEIDKISNPSRPYARGALTEKEMRYLKNFSVAALFILVAIMYSLPLFFITVANVFLSIVYSPLRARKYFFAFVIAALGESTAVWYGYFGQQPSFADLPHDIVRFFIAFFWLLCFFLPVKDIKDRAGDLRAGVKNILTVFGWNKAKIIIAGMVFLGYVGMPFLLWGSASAVAAFFPFSILSAFFIFQYERFGEQPLYLIFFIAVFLMLSSFVV